MCERCQISFEHHSVFIRHQQKKLPCLPPGQARFFCGACDEKFPSNAKLQSHLKGSAHRNRVLASGTTAADVLGHNSEQQSSSSDIQPEDDRPNGSDAIAVSHRHQPGETDGSVGGHEQMGMPIPSELQRIFDANPFRQPALGGFIRQGLSEAQMTWYDSLQVARLSAVEPFPVVLDGIWESLGFARKDVAVRILRSKFTLDIDYVLSPLAGGGGGHTHNCPDTVQYRLSLETAQHLAMAAPGTNGRQVRDMYIRVVKRVQEYEVLTRLYQLFHATRLAHHESILKNCTGRGYAYLSQPMMIDGVMRAKPGYTDGTPKERYSGLKSQFGTAENSFMFDRVARVDNASTVEDALLTKSKFAPRVSPVTLANGNTSTETFEIGNMTQRDIHKEFDRIVKIFGRMLEDKTESEREDVRQLAHDERMRETTLKIETQKTQQEVARSQQEAERTRQEAEKTQRGKDQVRLAEIELEKLRLQMASCHAEAAVCRA